jgi:DMSO/TMAO reductase YedYZ molybdopterin-dependent catalytic subunit
VLVGSAVLTGALAFAIGGRWAFPALAAHGAAGLGIVLLSPWKSVISRRGVRRRRPGTGASILLAALVAVTVATGVAHAIGWSSLLVMQVHVAAALATVPLVIWHVFVRPVRPRRTDLSRRSLLRAGVVAGGSVAAFAAVEGIVRVSGAPGAERRSTGSYERGSFEPGAMPVTQWLDDADPAIRVTDWRLEVRAPRGARTLTYDEVARYDDRVRATLDCTGGWFATQDWSGVRLDRLLGDDDEIRSVLVTSATGYARRFPVGDSASIVLATRVGGEPLAAGYGFPARLVVPGRRGFWWVKWVERIEAASTPWWWQSPFPLT